MDPPGFALESFDVMGGYRERYRAVSDKVPPVKGYGMNGQAFEFHYALPVDSAGELPDGRPFKDVRELKKLLVQDEVPIARNLVRQLTVFATGAPVRFSDREEIEKILDRGEGQPVRRAEHRPRDRAERAVPEQMTKRPGDEPTDPRPTLTAPFASTRRPISRRRFLRGAGVALALPLLESMRAPFARAADGPPAPRRMFCDLQQPGPAAGAVLPQGRRPGLHPLAVPEAAARTTAPTSPSSAACRTRTWTAATRRTSPS